SAMPPTAVGAIARLAKARLVANGVDPAPILQEARLSTDELANHHTRIAVASQITVLNLAAHALRDEVLGFRLAQTFELREVGLLYFVLASSATLGEALTRAERYCRVGNEGITLQYSSDSECCIRYK